MGMGERAAARRMVGRHVVSTSTATRHAGGQPRQRPVSIVSPAYFQTLDIPILEGRGFTDRDTRRAVRRSASSTRRSFAATWAAGTPLGMRLVVRGMTTGGAALPVAEDRRRRHAGEGTTRRSGAPSRTSTCRWHRTLGGGLAGRAAGRRAGSGAHVGRPGGGRACRQGPAGRRRSERWPASAGRRRRGRASARCWSAPLRALALVLAMVGVFGVLAYSVQQRTREFGVRIALGASVSDVMRLVLASAARTTAAGVAIGLAGAGGVRVDRSRHCSSACRRSIPSRLARRPPCSCSRRRWRPPLPRCAPRAWTRS